MLKAIHLLIIALLLLANAGCNTEIPGQQTKTHEQQQTGTYYGRAVKIIDGDTFDLLMDDNQRLRIRMHGIDCPERAMDYYKAAKDALGDLCNSGRLKVVQRDKDQYGRTVADAYTEDGRWINLELVKGGFAWHYTHYDHDQRLEDAEQAARAAKLGLWALDNPTPPWEWRKEKRHGKQ